MSIWSPPVPTSRVPLEGSAPGNILSRLNCVLGHLIISWLGGEGGEGEPKYALNKASIRA